MEAEVFLLGHWANYDELEESLSLPELSETLRAMQERAHREHKFLAAIQGVDIDDGDDETKAAEIRARGERRAQLEREGATMESIINTEFVDIGQAYHVDDT